VDFVSCAKIFRKYEVFQGVDELWHRCGKAGCMPTFVFSSIIFTPFLNIFGSIEDD
jgi:hypothetical protein